MASSSGGIISDPAGFGKKFEAAGRLPSGRAAGLHEVKGTGASDTFFQIFRDQGQGLMFEEPRYGFIVDVFSHAKAAQGREPSKKPPSDDMRDALDTELGFRCPEKVP